MRLKDCWFTFVLFLWLTINISAEPQEFALIKRLRFISGQPLGLKHCLCGPIYTPVCGSDGKTYPNICTAMCKVTVSNFFPSSRRQIYTMYIFRRTSGSYRLCTNHRFWFKCMLNLVTYSFYYSCLPLIHNY